MAKSEKMRDKSKTGKPGAARARGGSGGEARGLAKGPGTTRRIGTAASGKTDSGLGPETGAAERGRTKGSAVAPEYYLGAAGTAAGISTNVVAEKDIRLDGKKRATLTGAEFEHYHMVVTSDGTIVLEPRVLSPASISRRTLAMIDESMGNYAAGNVGDAIDFDRYQELLEEGDG